MRFLRTASTARLLALLLGAVTAAAASAAIALAATSGNGPKPRPKPLAQAVHDALAAPTVPGVSARIKFVNHLIDSTAIDGAGPLISGASGRLWASADGKFRLELQGTDGDVQIVSNGASLLVYDSARNTAYRAQLPAEHKPRAKAARHERPPSVARIQKGINQARTHVGVSGAIPTDVAGRPAYEVRVAPQRGGLLSGIRLAWDATRGLPLRVAVYARGDSSPVLSLTATSISFGRVPASTFAISPPPGATVEDLTPHSGSGTDKRRLTFKLSAPKRLAGRSRQRITRMGDGALIGYGRGVGGLLVIEQKSGGAGGVGGRQQRDLGLSLPTVGINGTTAQELPTALGTVVRFTRGGVDYIVLGSQPASTVLAAARSL